MDQTDLLQIKIEKARAQLSSDTLTAIAAVPWQASIIKMRETKGYTFEQLGTLEIETELLLSGLLSPEAYPHELEKRMGLSAIEANDLVKEMNEQVFKRIKEELIKISEKKSPEKMDPQLPPTTPSLESHEESVLSSAGIKILDESKPVVKTAELAKDVVKVEPGPVTPKPVIAPAPHAFLEQKLNTSVQTEPVKTDHSPIVPKAEEKPATNPTYPKGRDPYRLPPI